MKNKVLSILVLLFLSVSVYSQSCLPDGIIFISQSQVDSFQINNPGCTIIEGGVTIGPENSWDEIDISNLDSLIVVNEIQGDLIVWNNDLLSNLTGFDSLVYVGGDLRIETNSSVENLLGLEQLTSIGGSLNIFGGNYITSLSGIDNLSSIGGSIQIAYGNALTDISALSSLTTMNGELKINNNVSLSTLNGLESIDPASISSLVITSNSTLSDCAVQSLCDYLSDGTGSSSISSNNMGCNSDNQILSACISLGLDEFVTDGFTIYPNPAKDILYISSTTQKKVDRIRIFSQLGQEVLLSDNTSAIDISSLPSGMYLIEIQSDGQKMRSKIMIE